MKIVATKTFEFKDNDLIDILSTCFEGGCSYWCCIDNTTEEWKEARKIAREAKPDRLLIEDVMLTLLKQGNAILLEDAEDEEEVYELTLAKFEKGIRMSIEKGDWNGDIYDLDGCSGDAIIQYGLFDEIVFG